MRLKFYRKGGLRLKIFNPEFVYARHPKLYYAEKAVRKWSKI